MQDVHEYAKYLCNKLTVSLILHTKTESIENEVLCDQAEEEKRNTIFFRFYCKER